MKLLFKLIKWGVLSFLLLLIVLVLGRNFLIKQSAKTAVKAALGMELWIDDVDVGLFHSTFRIQGLTARNPQGFGDTSLIQVPLVYVDYDLPSMMGGKPHFREIEVNVSEVCVVKNAAGDLNLNKIKAVATQGSSGDKKKEDKPKEEGKKVEMRIDKLTLTIGKVRYIELDKAGKVDSDKEYSVGVDHEVFEGLNSPEEVVRLVVLRAVKAAGLKGLGLYIGSLASSGLDHVKGKGMEMLDSIGSGLKNGVGKAGEAAKGLFDGIRKKFSNDN